MDLNQVTVPCFDYRASVGFYKKLGLRQIVDSPPRYARFETPGGSTFSIHKVAPNVAGSGTVVYFEVDDVDEVFGTLSAAGIVFDSEPADQSWRWREVHLSDLAGNRLCIYNAGEDRRYPPWKIC